MPEINVGSADEWQSIASTLLVPHVCQTFQPGFHGHLEFLKLDGGVSIARTDTDGLRVERSKKLAKDSPNSELHLSLQLASDGQISTPDRTATIRPGQVATYAAFGPYRLDYTRAGQRQLIVQLPFDQLDLPERFISQACERLIMPDTPLTRVLFRFAAGQLPGRIARAADARASAGTRAVAPVDESPALRDLAAAMIRSASTGQKVMPATSRGLYLLVNDFVRENFRSPALTVETLAMQHFLSRRRLYQLFERYEQSPADEIRDLRLTHAESLLVTRTDLAVADVATRSGFLDPTTFARAFQRRNGCNPSTYRAAMSAGAADHDVTNAEGTA